MAVALPLRSLEVPDRPGGRGADRRRRRGSEDESRRIRAYRIDDIGVCRDVAAEAAERLRQRALRFGQRRSRPKTFFLQFTSQRERRDKTPRTIQIQTK